MKKSDQSGFIPMLIAIILLVVIVIYFAFIQVAKAQR